ncbi:hypothetical protein NP493_91g00004 [Ridgeia piscesae]|uniref:Uncharacterized protein n=1 Tax=Ridgeia piscesae TaxID=27915 RepID=A0AAD9UHU2_RIDPI|nr:hypothetical protein NP493_91g00004 [Ridgeia piscesae]
MGSSRDRSRSPGDRTGSSQRSLPGGEVDVTANHFGIAVRHSPGDDDDDVDLMKPMGYGQTLCPGGDASLDDDTNLMKPPTLQLTSPNKDWSARNYKNDGTRV